MQCIPDVLTVAVQCILDVLTVAADVLFLRMYIDSGDAVATENAVVPIGSSGAVAVAAVVAAAVAAAARSIDWA